ncbi:helix-turn-helix transcriptional regulator [Sphingomonas jatrophae]|uniref:DNA-binding transcriptional regulator, CsgD family n=1 Tax=Sphingomonas jatrophae TaxID=1166337 RepID=A0A1I6KLT8_9SPHN|nr:hypothetical protein [Sphingomonas jatrophae]SFR92223.1 DNA-binding transcriptional regulator, CsgD family [Sphingomonas jatrophae]
MTLSRSDEIDLLTVLHDGVHEEPRWATFLGRMLRRTRADHVSLIVAQGDTPIHRAAQWFAGRDVRSQADRLDHLAGLDPTPYHRLRPGRVYAATEMMDPQDAGHSRFQRDYLERIGIRFGRFMRITERGGGSAWLSVTRTADDFSAADSALLSSLAPHLSIALRTLAELDRARFRAAVADDALRRAGVGWTALDREARPLDRGGSAPPGERPLGQLPAALPMAVQGAGDPPLDLLAVPVPERPLAASTMPTVVALTRVAPMLGEGAADALVRLFALSAGEARLAVRLAEGESLADAATALGLTIETARNYSKRLYAKTATRGQADLVRLVLTSVASLA